MVTTEVKSKDQNESFFFDEVRNDTIDQKNRNVISKWYVK